MAQGDQAAHASASARTAPRRTVLGMSWDALAFLHWPVPPEALRPTLPPGLELDVFEGEAWLGVVPFQMRATRFDWTPPMPTASTFLELNLRTYVRRGDRRGVWFYSLDAASFLAVRGARLGFALPYFDARMEMDGEAGEAGVQRYRSERRHRGVPGASFSGAYRPSAPAMESSPGSLEHFLTERYCLFAQRGHGVRFALRGGLLRGDILHEPWPLQPAEVELERCDMFRVLGPEALRAAGLAGRELSPPVAHFAASIDVRAAPPVRA